MRVAGALRLFALRSAWATSRLPAAGWGLIRALESPDEDERAMAAMWLVRSGKKSESLLIRAMSERRSVDDVLTILGDIGLPKYRDIIRRYLEDPDPSVRRSAREALRVLNVHPGTDAETA